MCRLLLMCQALTKHSCTNTISFSPCNIPMVPVITPSGRYNSTGKLSKVSKATSKVRDRAGLQIESDSRAHTLGQPHSIAETSPKAGQGVWFPVTKHLDPRGCGMAKHRSQELYCQRSSLCYLRHMRSATLERLGCARSLATLS